MFFHAQRRQSFSNLHTEPASSIPRHRQPLRRILAHHLSASRTRVENSSSFNQLQLVEVADCVAFRPPEAWVLALGRLTGHLLADRPRLGRRERTAGADFGLDRARLAADPAVPYEGLGALRRNVDGQMGATLDFEMNRQS